MSRTERRITVMVCDERLARLYELAESHERQAMEIRGATDQLQDQQGYTRIEARYLGYIGQYAATKVYGRPFDWSTYEYGDSGRDFALAGGRTVQVKATRHQSGNMTQAPNREIKTELLVSTIVMLPATVTIVGWCSRSTWERYARGENYGRSDTPTPTLKSMYLADPATMAPIDWNPHHLVYINPYREPSRWKFLVCDQTEATISGL